MKDLGKPLSPDEEALFPPVSEGEDSPDLEGPLFGTDPRREDSADFELPADFFEPIVLPEEGDAGDHLVQTLWPEIPADDPSHDLPQAIERWSDERAPMSQRLRVALIAGALMVAILGSLVVWRVVLRRPQPSSPALAGPAPSAPPAAAPVAASPNLAAPAAPVTRAPARPAAPVPATAAPIPPPGPRVVMPEPESQRAAAPAVAPPPLTGIPMPAENDPRPAVVGPVAPSAAAATPAPRPENPEPSAAPTAAPSAARPPIAPAPSSAAPPVVTDELRLRALMDRYRAAFAALDVAQARAVWPSVDARALSRAFGQLISQSFDFSSCEVQLTGDRASAGCSGNAEYVTKVGSRTPRVDGRVWQFEFRRVDQQWRIESVVTR